MTTPPDHPKSPANRPQDDSEYWDYAEDEALSAHGAHDDDGDILLEADDDDIEGEDALDGDAESESDEDDDDDDEVDEVDDDEAEDELDDDDLEEELDEEFDANEAETEHDDDDGDDAAALDDDDLDDDDDDDLDDDDDDDDDDDLGEGIEVEPSGSERRSRAPIIWALAAAAWVGVFAVKYGGGKDNTTQEGPSLAVVEQDEDEAEPTREAPTDAPELDADDHTPPPPPEAEADDEGPSKIKLPEGLHGRWFDANWASDLTPPKRVFYTVKRGGSIKFIANLYKIYHHEIEAMNPGVPLEKELGPGTKVVVYERPANGHSESIGLATRGRLEGGVPMLDGPGRILKHTPWKGFATDVTVAMMDRALTAWSERGNDVQPVLVGNMSSREGGRLKPHGSHQSGRDVDLSYIQKGPDAADLNWREMTAENLDAAETWKLLETLVATRAVEHIFIDTKLQKVLYDYAVANKLVSRRDLSTWLEYPRPVGSANAIVKHVKGHSDHIHVRFGCPADMQHCSSK